MDLYGNWQNMQTVLPPKNYTCGHMGCGREVGSTKGLIFSNSKTSRPEAFIYVCPVCCCPTFFDDLSGSQIPGVSFGRNVESLPRDINELYDEIRKSTSVGAYTSAVMGCRKILMHIAVEKGAKDGLNFIEYVDYLVAQHFAPPNSNPWVDKIRTIGNEANHEIQIMSMNEATELINFVEMLLKFIYEFPAKIGTPS